MQDHDYTVVESYEDVLDEAADVLRDAPAFTVEEAGMQSGGDDLPFPDALTDADEYRDAYDVLWKYQWDDPAKALYRFAVNATATDRPTIGTVSLSDPVPRTTYDRNNPDERDSTGESLTVDLRITEDLTPYTAIDEGILNPEKCGVKAYIQHVTDVLYNAGLPVEDRYTGDIMHRSTTPSAHATYTSGQQAPTDDD